MRRRKERTKAEPAEPAREERAGGADDQAARKARARALRETIRDLKDPSKRPPPANPRDYIERHAPRPDLADEPPPDKEGSKP